MDFLFILFNKFINLQQKTKNEEYINFFKNNIKSSNIEQLITLLTNFTKTDGYDLIGFSIIETSSLNFALLIQDSSIAENIDKTIINLRKSSKGLNENMNAAKENFLLKGYFNRKARAA